MKTVDIMETIAECIEKKILGEWKHEGYIDGMESERAHFEIDGKKYVITIEPETSIEKVLEAYSNGRKGA